MLPFGRFLAAVVFGALAFASLASAMSIRELRALEKTEKLGSTYTDYYLVGVMEGLLEAHDSAVRAGAAPTICLRGRHLAPRMARGLYSAEIRRNSDLYEADMPVQMVMRAALESSYACD